MWTGAGSGEGRRVATFARPFRSVPEVQVTLSLLGPDGTTNAPAEMQADIFGRMGLGVVFRALATIHTACAKRPTAC